MRFATLFSKEFRECLPWMLLAAIVLLAFGGFLVHMHVLYNSLLSDGGSPLGESISPSRLVFYRIPSGLGPLLFCSAIGLGLILGVRQFWTPNFTRTWPFLLHRSASRSTVLAAKLTAASVALVLATGGVWVCLFWYACRPEVSPIPQPVRIFIHGWIFVILGLITYLGTALSGMSEARWYTTKIFGIAFAFIIVCIATAQWSLIWALCVLAFGAALLLAQLFDTFATREF